MTSIAPFPFGITVTVQRGTRGKYGDIVYSDHHTLSGCAMAPRYSSEVTDNRNTVIVGFSLFGPPQTGTDKVLADDRIKTADGNIYRVVGEAADWEHPITGWKPGFEAALERVK